MLFSGDGRASEQPGLLMIHTMYMREHNRVMEGLQVVNPHWDHDKIFEQARKIVVAGLQHVTYNEFLPRLLGWNAVNLYGLKLLSQGYYKDYNPSCNPSIFTEFAAAAFRIGHSLLRPHIPRLDENYQIVDPPLLLRDFFFNTDYMMKASILDHYQHFYWIHFKCLRSFDTRPIYFMYNNCNFYSQLYTL